MVPSLWQRIRWYIQPPSLFEVMRVVQQPQIEMNEFLSRLNKKLTDGGWANALPSESLIKQIKQQVADYDNTSFLVRAWWWFTGKHPDVAFKRVWLFYHACQSLALPNQVEPNSLASAFNLPAITTLAAQPYLLSSWRKLLNSILLGVNYVQESIRKQNEVDMLGRHGRSKNPTFFRHSKRLNNANHPSYSSTALSTALITESLPLMTYESQMISLQAFYCACGVFNLDVSNTTPRQITSAMRKLALSIHPDKAEHRYITESGEERDYSTKALNSYKEFRTIQFRNLQKLLNAIKLPLDETPYARSKINGHQIQTWFEEGRQYRACIDSGGEMGKEIAALGTNTEIMKHELSEVNKKHIAFEKELKEINNEINEMDNKQEARDKDLYEIDKKINERGNKVKEINNEVKEIRNEVKEMNAEVKQLFELANKLILKSTTVKSNAASEQEPTTPEPSSSLFKLGAS